MTVHTYPKGSLFQCLDDIPNKHITVMGLGLNGGGLATVKFFLRYGATVTVTDMKSAEQLAPTIRALENDAKGEPALSDAISSGRLIYHLGAHDMEDFVNADCVIKNPGVKFDGNKYLDAAPVIESDLSVFLALSPSPIIAVTGSKGKSSTVSAIHWILTQCGMKAFLGGNITVSPLTFLSDTSIDTPVVLELSSWQLADLRGRALLRPRISIITKIVPDHQNWYGDMASYVADKRLIYADQSSDDYAIFDTDEWGDSFASEAKAQVLRYSTSTLPDGVLGAWQKNGGRMMGTVGMVRLSSTVSKGGKGKGSGVVERVVMRDLLLPGTHVRTNALNAALASCLAGLPAAKVCRAIGSWPGIEHRLQLCHQWVWVAGGVTHKVHFYDDSCSTVSEAVAAAIASFDVPIVLIAGGTDKGLRQDMLADCLAQAVISASHSDNAVIGTACHTVLALYLLSGTATDSLLPLLEERGVIYEGVFDTLEGLMAALKNDIQCGRIASLQGAQTLPVVFSPGATSFGMFANEFDRGDKFQAAVRAMF